MVDGDAIWNHIFKPTNVELESVLDTVGVIMVEVICLPAELSISCVI